MSFPAPTLTMARTVRLHRGHQHRRVLAVRIRPEAATASVKTLDPASGLPQWVQVIGPKVAGTVTDYWHPTL